MANLLLSGPAFGGKSQVLRQLLEDTPDSVAADFQSLYAAVRQEVRGPDGKYPERTIDSEVYLSLIEYLRRATITTARQRGLTVFATNSSGDPDIRGGLLDLLGPDSEERIIDPGEAVATARAAEADGEPRAACAQALQRWYSAHYRANPRRRR